MKKIMLIGFGAMAQAVIERLPAGVAIGWIVAREVHHAAIHAQLGDAVVAQKFARELQKEGIYVTGFFFPVVPKGQARIRTQMSAAHSPEQIERAVEAFTRIGKQLGVIA